MTGYLLRRSGVSIVVLIGITMVIYFLLHEIYPLPGRVILGVRASRAAVAAWNGQHGFAGSVPVQYWHYLSALLHGNLGYSFKLNQPVVSLFEQRWARSLYLSGVSLLLAILVTIPLGIYQAVRRDRLGDHFATGLELTLYAMPDFLFYMIAIQLFVFTVPLFNYEASQSTSLLAVMADWHSMTLPIACSAALGVATLSRYMRSAVIDTLANDYIAVARAKGLPERLVLSRHLLRNACLPMITLIGISIPILLTGNLFVETVFSYHGLGLLFITSLQNADYPVQLALTLVASVLTVLGNLLADVALTMADPRLRLTKLRQ
jgi:peptide/nickel transport system permease protein